MTRLIDTKPTTTNNNQQHSNANMIYFHNYEKQTPEGDSKTDVDSDTEGDNGIDGDSDT